MKEFCPNKECPYLYISEKRNRELPVSRTEECLLEKQHKPCVEEETEVEDKTDRLNLGC